MEKQTTAVMPSIVISPRPDRVQAELAGEGAGGAESGGPVHTSGIRRHNVFVEGETPVIGIVFTAEGGAPHTARSFGYRIADWRGVTVEEGTAEVMCGERGGECEISPASAAAAAVGWYCMELDAGSGEAERTLHYAAAAGLSADRGHFVAYAVVPRAGAVRHGDSPFGLDVAASSSASMEPEALARLAQLAGVSWVRDRLDVKEVLPQPDRPQYERVKRNARLFVQRGIRVLQVYHGSPAWSVRSGEKMTADLTAMYRFAERTGAELGGDVQAIELWNEPDIAAAADRPPDHYAALLKAASLGLDAAAFPGVKLPGPFARDPRAGRFGETLLQNGIADYVDGYSFHSYFPVQGGRFGCVIDVHAELAERFGMAGKPVWLTETGRSYSRGGEVPDFAAASREQVKYTVQSFAISAGSGIARIFPFLLRPYVNANVQFGFMRTDETPMPAYSALAALTSVLGKGALISKLNAPGAAVYLFDTGRSPDADGESGCEQAAIVWSEGSRSLPLRANAGRRRLRLFDALGRELPAPGPELPLEEDGMPVYVTGYRLSEALEQSAATRASRAADVKANEGAKPAEKVRHLMQLPARDATETVQNGWPSSDKDVHATAVYLPVVLFAAIAPRYIRQEDDATGNFDGVASRWAPRGYELPRDEPLELELNIYNFAHTQTQIKVWPVVPPGLTVQAEAAEKRTAALAPMGREALRYFVRRNAEAVHSDSVYTLAFAGEADGKPLAPSVLQLYACRVGEGSRNELG